MHRPLREARPQRLDIRLLAQGRITHVLGSVRLIEAITREVQIKRTYLDVHADAARLSLSTHLQRPLRGQMNDVDRRSGSLGNGDSALRGHHLRNHRMSVPVVAHRRLASRGQLGFGVVDQVSVLAVDHGDEPVGASTPRCFDVPINLTVEVGKQHEVLDAAGPVIQ